MKRWFAGITVPIRATVAPQPLSGYTLKAVLLPGIVPSFGWNPLLENKAPKGS
jgi:hypothetical protein